MTMRNRRVFLLASSMKAKNFERYLLSSDVDYNEQDQAEIQDRHRMPVADDCLSLFGHVVDVSFSLGRLVSQSSSFRLITRMSAVVCYSHVTHILASFFSIAQSWSRKSR